MCIGKYGDHYLCYLFRLWVQSVLDVALSHDAEVPDDFDGRVPQHVVFMVVQCLTGRHHDGFSGMDAQRVNILHVTHLKKKKMDESFLSSIILYNICASGILHVTFKLYSFLFGTLLSGPVCGILTFI